LRADLSVIIPVARMAGRLLKFSNFLESVEPGKVEIIVILDMDDSATSQELEKILSGFPLLGIKYCRDYYGSPGAARNAGLELVTSEWVWFCDADDEPIIATALRALQTVPEEFDALIFNYSKVNEISGLEYVNPGTLDRISVCINPGLWRMLLRKEIIYPTKFQKYSLGEDQLFIINIRIFHRNILFINEIIYKYSFGGEGHLINRRDKVDDLFQVYKRTISAMKHSRKDEIQFMALIALRQLLTLLRIGPAKIKIMSISKIFNLFFEGPKILINIVAVIPIFLGRRLI
jgi:glycosyltransferase involved in cell wall biosynthesis